MVSTLADERHVRRAARSGARGYVLKDSPKENLIEAVRRVSRGLVFASAPVRKVFEEAFKRRREPEAPDRFDRLTNRERQVYRLLAEGRTTKEIASDLASSVHTIETHRYHIMAKLSVHTLAELVLEPWWAQSKKKISVLSNTAPTPSAISGGAGVPRRISTPRP